MIDIVSVVKKQVDTWDDEKHCGWCWKFGAPLSDAMLNRSKSDEEICDCVQVYLTNLNIQNTPVYNLNVSRYSNELNRIYNFDLNFLMFDELGVNVYNEIPNHPISESTWSRILTPLLECYPQIDFCEPDPTIVLQRDMWRPVIRKYDNNLSGWRVSVTLTQKIRG